MTFRSLAALAAVLGACGGNNPGSAVSHNNGGTGSLNLSVKADIDSVLGATTTDLVVTLKDGNGNKVSGGTVTLFNAAWGTVTLTETAAGSGDYRKTQQTAFPGGDFGLAVSCNPCQVPAISTTATLTGNIQGVVLGGPGMHSINYPKQNVAVPMNQAVAVSWTTPTQAASASIMTNNFGPVLAADTGAYTIPAANNPPAATQNLNVARYNEVAIAGGLLGSRFRVTVEANVSYPVQ